MLSFLHSLRFRLMMLVLLAVIPAFGLALSNASAQRRVAIEQVEDDALRLAWITADHNNELVEGARQFLFSLAQMPVMHENDPVKCGEFLSTIKTNYPRYANIVMADLSGGVICDAISSGFTGKIPEDGFPQDIIKTKNFTIGNYIISPTFKKPTIGFGYPLIGSKGEVKSLLIVALNLGSLDELFSEVQLPPGSTLTLRDRNGTILSHFPDPEKWVGLNASDFEDPGTQLNLQQAGTIEAVGNDGIPRLYAFTPVRNVSNSGLTITVGIPKAVAFAEANRMLIRNLLTLGSVTAIAFIITLIYSELSVLRQIRSILNMTEKLADGDLSARTGVAYNQGELNQLALAFDTMAASLEKRDVEGKEIHEALEIEERAHARLLHQVITAHEDERKRIARELHDETSQSVTALMIGLERTRIELGRDSGHAGEQLQNVKVIAEKMLLDIHQIIGNLRPSLLDDLGLVPAITWCSEKLLLPVGIEMTLTTEGMEKRLPAMVETVIFRVVQEALTNIVRHSQASQVTVFLKHQENELLVNVLDNGQGYNLEDRSTDVGQRGFGLESMRERVLILGGEIQIHSAPGDGTQVSARVPIPKNEGEYV